MSNTTRDRVPRSNAPSATSAEAGTTTRRQDGHDTAFRSEKISATHVQRSAIVYVRQSTP